MNILPNARRVEQYLDFLSCPYCKCGLSIKSDSLICSGCNRTFEIKNNIPVLLPDFILKSREWQKWNDMDMAYRDFYDEYMKKPIEMEGKKTYDAFYDWCNISDVEDVALLDVGGG